MGSLELDNLTENEIMQDADLDENLLNSIFKQTYPHERLARFEVLASKMLGVGDLTYFSVEYELYSNGEHKGRWECQGSFTEPCEPDIEIDEISQRGL